MKEHTIDTLADAVAEDTGYPRAEVETTIRSVIHTIRRGIVEDKRGVQLHGIGRIVVSEREMATSFNQGGKRTALGRAIKGAKDWKPGFVVRFQPSERLKDLVNGRQH